MKRYYLGRLTNWDYAGRTDAGEYTYDGLGNMETIGHLVVDNSGNENGGWGHGLTYDGRHVDTVDGGTATHDTLGRWTQLAGAPGGQDFTADYNRFDLPTQVVRDGATHTYRYDSSGARVYRTSSGPGGLTSQTDFETAGGRFTKEVDASGTPTWRLTVLGGNGPVVEVHIEAYDENPQHKRFLHNDHLASRTLETDSGGAVLSEHRTTPFGERLDTSGAPIGFGNALISGFGGHDHEASAFIDMGGRHYDPSIGRFLTVDPVNIEPFNPQSANGYAYVMNDPVTLRDPTGLWPCGGDFCDPPIGNVDDEFSRGGGDIWYETEPSPSSSSQGGGNRNPSRRPPPERERIVDVQQARTPRSDTPTQGMSLPMVQPPLLDMGLTLGNEPFDVPSPREVASAAEEPWMTWDEAGQYGLAVAEVGGSMLPWVGEAMDLAVIMDSSEPTWARVLSGVSLVVSPLSLGFAPNFGATRRAATRVARTAAGAAARFCFEAGTLVETPDGRVRIEDLEAGDLVYSYDEVAGVLVIREVVQTFQREVTSLIDLAVADPQDGTQSTISGTAEHPFFVSEYGQYVGMADLVEGMELLSADGEALVVVGRSVREGQFEVFNFEVTETHNYFVVGQGEHVGLLVHNSCFDRGARHVMQDHPERLIGTGLNRVQRGSHSAVTRFFDEFVEHADEVAEGAGDARVWRRGSDILILRPGRGHGGTFIDDLDEAGAIRFVENFW